MVPRDPRKPFKELCTLFASRNVRPGQVLQSIILILILAGALLLASPQITSYTASPPN